MLARLLDLRAREGVRLRDFAQALGHLRELRRVQRFHGELDYCVIIKTRGLKNGAGVITGIINDSGRFGHVLPDAFQDDAIARARLQHFGDVSAMAHAHTLYDAGSLVLGVFW
jgi:hypothetical protein